MAPDSNGQPERICSLSGPRDAICRAKELIMNIVHQRGRTEGYGPMGDLLGPGGNGGGGGGGPMGPGGPGGPGGHSSGGGGGGGNGGPGGPVGPGGVAHVEIMVPGPKVGLIIGKGGETIKQLQEKSGAKMVVIQDGPNQEQEKPLRISGDPQKVEYAKQLVYDLIAEKEMQAYSRRGGRNDRNEEGGGRGPPGMGGPGGYNEYGGPGGGGGEGVEVAVPRAAVGVVIGKGGDMIKKIQAETGARVQFQQGRDEGPGDRRCLLTGKSQNVDMARQRIEELIDSVIVSICPPMVFTIFYHLIISVEMMGARTTEEGAHLAEAEMSAMTAAATREEVAAVAAAAVVVVMTVWVGLEGPATEIMNTVETTTKAEAGATGTSLRWKSPLLCRPISAGSSLAKGVRPSNKSTSNPGPIASWIEELLLQQQAATRRSSSGERLKMSRTVSE